MFDLRSSRNREHYRRFLKQPRKRDLRRLCFETFRCARQRTCVFCEFAGPKWKERDKTEVFLGAMFQHFLGASIDQVVSILHGYDRCDAPDRLNLVHPDFGQSNMANLTVALKIDQRAYLIFDRYSRIDPVKL